MASCNSCGAEIVWARTATGKAMPMERDDGGDWVIVDGEARRAVLVRKGTPRYVSHFAKCPQAPQWRQKKP